MARKLSVHPTQEQDMKDNTNISCSYWQLHKHSLIIYMNMFLATIDILKETHDMKCVKSDMNMTCDMRRMV